jgi:hypothetical protein
MYKFKDFLNLDKNALTYDLVFRVDTEFFDKVDNISKESLMKSSSIMDYITIFSDKIDETVEITNLSQITTLFYMIGYAVKLIESSFASADNVEKEIENKLNFFIHLLKGIEKTL